MFFSLYFYFSLRFFMKYLHAGTSFIWCGCCDFFSKYFSLLLSIIAFNVWFQRLTLVQTADAFWINNSCLALNKLSVCASWWVKVIVYNIIFGKALPFPFFFFFFKTLSHMNILVQFENSLFHFNVLYTFVLLMDMIAFLVFNNGEIECHQCRCMYM